MRSVDAADALPLTREQLRTAALAVCAAATDVIDAEELLDCLGLIDELKPRRMRA